MNWIINVPIRFLEISGNGKILNSVAAVGLKRKLFVANFYTTCRFSSQSLLLVRLQRWRPSHSPTHSIQHNIKTMQIFPPIIQRSNEHFCIIWLPPTNGCSRMFAEKTVISISCSYSCPRLAFRFAWNSWGSLWSKYSLRSAIFRITIDKSLITRVFVQLPARLETIIIHYPSLSANIVHHSGKNELGEQ